MIFQEPMTSLNPVYSIGDQIVEAVTLHQQVGRRRAYEIAEEALHAVGIADPHRRLFEYPHQMSGGMRQRVAFMRTLVTRHQLLLLDEPFGALDAQTRLDMQRWLLDVWRESGRTVLFITHDVDESIFLSDRILVMSPRPGRIVADLANTLARPREIDILTDPTFVELKSQILRLLHGGER